MAMPGVPDGSTEDCVSTLGRGALQVSPKQVSGDNDRSLVARLQQGDDSAFEQLIDRYKTSVLNFIYRLIGDASGAEDAAQDVFVRVYRNIGRFRFSKGQESCAAWIYQIARNEVIDRTRRKMRHPESTLDEDGILEGLRSQGPSAAQEASAHDVGARIASAVASLPEDQQTAFVLCEYNDLGYAEIAEVMKCTIKSVESRLYRAKETLRDQLRDLID